MHVFNFFPTSQSDEHLGLEGNIISKIQAFHDMLGEDAKYLSDEEEVTQHDLRGQVLYRKLTSRETFGEDATEEEESDLAYLQVIRQVRDNDPGLFELLKRLPKKARAGWLHAPSDANTDVPGDQLVTFFRMGRLKKFFVSAIHGSREVDFFDAVDLMKCEPDTARQKIPRTYYDLLVRNKEEFDSTLEGENAPKSVGGGHTNTRRVLVNIRAAQKDNAKMTDEDEDYLRLARQAFEEGRMPSKTSQRIMQKVKKAGRSLNGLKILAILREEVDASLIFAETTEITVATASSKREIILSAYLQQPVAD